MDLRKHSVTSNLIRVVLKHASTGAPLTGLTEASSGLIIGTIADVESATTRYRASSSEIETITTLGTFAAPSSSKCRFKEVDATNHPGLYEIQLADARFSVSNARRLVVSWSGATNLLAGDYEIRLVQFDPQDATRLGLTALPNAAAEASGGLPTLSAAQGSNGTINVNVHRWLTSTPNALQSGRVDSYLGAAADAVLTAAKFASGAFDAVWSVTTRLLTAGTNIVLAKGTGVTGFNDLSAAQVNAEADTALADAGVTTTRTGYLDNLSAGAVATAAKLLSYFQSALRKDVTVDADIGGNYDDATDSQEAIRDRGDAAWTTATGFSTHTAADVWAVATRTLTAFDATFKTGYALSSAGVQAIWDALTSALATVGSIGKLLVDNINATISSRAPESGGNVAAIKAKTDNLPSDPADASDIADAFSTVNTTLAAIVGYIDTEVAAIKAKTDNLPVNPAATGDAMTLTSGERTNIADEVLTRDWSEVNGEASRSLLNAGRFQRNKFTIVGDTLTVYKEDDVTVAWTATITKTPGDPVSASDPA